MDQCNLISNIYEQLTTLVKLLTRDQRNSKWELYPLLSKRSPNYKTLPPVSFSIGSMQRVAHSLRLQTTKTYSELGSCPSLNNISGSMSGSRPLLSRNIPGCMEEGAAKPVEEMVQTATGMILVARQGDPRKPAIFTYHDIALNYLSNFHTFFNSESMLAVLDSFCVYHITAPGQENGAPDLPEDYTFPSLDELSEQVEYILHYYGIPHCVGFGVGLGANVMVRFAHRRPTMVDGLILINCNSQSAGWLEWVYHKVNIKNLKKSNATFSLPDSVIEYLLWYHLGKSDSDSRSLDTVSLASIFKRHFSCDVNSRNLCLLLQSYMQRTDLNLAREINSSNGKALYGATRTLKVPVINMTGDHSPHVEATVAFNGRLQPNKCTWMKIQDAAMILEEQSGKVAEAVKLFLQGLGYIFKPKRARSLTSTPLRRPGENTFIRSSGTDNEQVANLAKETAEAIENLLVLDEPTSSNKGQATQDLLMQ
ncbi:protein NDRG3-like isoform X2 [Tigriopus californicus]|uniref:protein NDRG3-like isoform X2 n=1 Tax=Tigriopus californicus TaxID=6832 RepID=UPI0027DA0C9D|nr:protein NDRG3-like isoform X2 [Tigriopus californicus]